MAVENGLFVNTSTEQAIDDDGYEEGKDKSRELPVKMDEKGNELFETPPHGATIEETYPGLFYGEAHPAGNLKKYNPPR